MYRLFIILLITTVTTSWTPQSWQTVGKRYQMPTYDNVEQLKKVKDSLLTSAPLVFAGECRELTEKLAYASIGKGFVLMGGDCAETFNDFSVEKIKNDFRLMLQMALILTYGSSTPIVKIGRVAGQFAKPRSENTEIIDGKTLPVYRGDIINGFELDSRTPDPKRILMAYHQSTQTLNLLRAFSNGGYADISQLHTWNQQFVQENKMYDSLILQVEKSLKFIDAIGLDLKSPRMTTTSYYTAHEALLLDYEEPLTRLDSITNEYYDCSAHMVWLGERTRQINSSHIEFLRGIKNSIGIKVSSNYNKNDIIKIINKLNPENKHGKIVLITRMGSEKLIEHLPELIQCIKKHEKNVLWVCDPMHANTIRLKGKKTRTFSSIKDEINAFFDIHDFMGTYPGGIHLELTSSNVTECVGGFKEIDLSKNYQTLCDPRLNGDQSLDLAFFIANKMKLRK
jgi:3-deoxy-7-phosphoheptulonate synthase